MQKLIKRAAQAQRQVARRATKDLELQHRHQRGRSRMAMREAVAELRQNIKDARRARNEDWHMGPLAPKRDLGFNDYGTISEPTRLDWSNHGLHQPRPKVLDQRCAWAGGAKQLCLTPQDRVVILGGPDKGKIDRIQSVQAETGTVTLEKCHRALAAGFLGAPARSKAMPISVGSVRLVYPIRNAETGVARDVVINQLMAVPPNMKSENMTLDRWEHGNKWDRLVPGINVVIPWPDVKAPEPEATPADTVRDEVEERTFFYSLLSPPMPGSVLDELRNKYSRFRTRHDAWYMEKKEAEAAAKKGRLDLIKSMQTPLDEFHEKQRQMREARGELQLTDDMLDKIGQIMARNKAAAVERAGATEVAADGSSLPSSSPPQ